MHATQSNGAELHNVSERVPLSFEIENRCAGEFGVRNEPLMPALEFAIPECVKNGLFTKLRMISLELRKECLR